MTCGTLTTVDILPAASGEDSYGVGGCSDLFGGFLSQPPYFGGGQRRGFTFGLSSHRSCGQKQHRAVGRKEERWALYPRPERRGFTAPLVKALVYCRRARLAFLPEGARKESRPKNGPEARVASAALRSGAS